MTNNDFLQQYVFHFNPYSKKWARINRNAYNYYMNGEVSGHDIAFSDSLLNLLTDTPSYEKPDNEKEDQTETEESIR